MAEFAYGRIPVVYSITRGRISVFSAIARKTDFLLGGCTEHSYILHPIYCR